MLLNSLLALAIASRFADLSRDWRTWEMRREAWEQLHQNMVELQRAGELE